MPLARALAACFTFLALAACSSPKVETYVKQGFEPADYPRVAVVDAATGSTHAGSRQAVVDEFVLRMLQQGMDVIDAGSVTAAKENLGLSNAGMATADERSRIAEALDVPGLLVVNLASDGELVSITAKLYDTASTDMVWMASGTKKVRSTLAAVGAGAAGAAAGYAMGGSGGAIAGGLVGSGAGRALAPKELETAKKVVDSLVGEFPTR